MSNLDNPPLDAQAALLPEERVSPSRPPMDTHVDKQIKPNKSAIERRRSIILLHGLPHLLPLLVTIAIICLNAREAYWQDLGLPNQNTKLQALQYAAKAHEMIMAGSLTAIVVYQIRYDLSGSNGVPLGFLTAGFQLNDLWFVLTKKLFGGATARAPSIGWSRFSRLTYLFVLGFALTSVVGPSSAVAMISRLDFDPRASLLGPEPAPGGSRGPWARAIRPAAPFTHTSLEVSPLEKPLKLA